MSTTVVTKVGTKNADQVVLLDAAGDQVTSFGGGTQYADGATAATPNGTQINWNDAGTQRAVSSAKPLPVSVTGGGDASAANQIAGNASLSSIDTKTPALGQALAAASVPVVIASNQSEVPVNLPDVTSTDGSTAPAQALVVSGVTSGGTAQTIEVNASGHVHIADGGGSITVDVGTALPAGTNNIGDVDVLTLPAVHFQDVYVTGQGSQLAGGQNVVLASAGTGSYDLLNGTTGVSFRSVSLTFVPAAGTVTAGVISFEGSNDNTNFVTIFLTDAANVTAVPVSTVTLAASTYRHFFGSIPFRYFRARISTPITGTTTGVQCFSVFSMVPFSSPRLAVTNATAASLLAQVNVASGGIASGAIASGAIASGAVAVGAIAAGATSIAENEDTAHTTGDRGLKVWGTSNEANTVRAADNDYVPFATDTEGNTRNVGNRDHDAVDAGEPLKIGGRARTTEITPVASNDRVDAVFDIAGKQIVLPYANPENFVSGAITTAMTGTTSTSLVAAPAAGLRNYITAIIVSNAHGTVGTDVVIQDGSGGTTLLTIPAAAVYGGAVITLPTPLRQPTTATALFCANVTTGASTKVSAVGYIGA